MTKSERNKEIEKMVKERIRELGYEGKLEFDSIPNTFTEKEDGTGVFTGFMWQMNSLSDDELAADIDARINEAVKYFKLK